MPGSSEDESAVPSMLAQQSAAFGMFRQRGTLRLSLAVGEAFQRGCASYLRRASLQKFAQPYTPDFRCCIVPSQRSWLYAPFVELLGKRRRNWTEIA